MNQLGSLPSGDLQSSTGDELAQCKSVMGVQGTTHMGQLILHWGG